MKNDRVIETQVKPSTGLTQTLALAFQDDPAIAWLVTDPHKRRRILPGFFNVMAAQSHRHGSVIASSEMLAAALIYPSGEVNDSRIRDSLRLLALFGAALPRGLRMAKAMHAHHPYPQPHLYLRYLGVAPSAQGQGLGGAIVRKVIRQAADKKQGVLLETAKASNVAIYARLGFDIVSEWDVPGGGPKFWTMIHPAP